MRYRLLLALWLVSDLLLFVGSYAIAYFLRVGWIFSSDFPFDQFFIATILTAPLLLAMLIVTRCFSISRRQRSARNIIYIVYSCFTATALFGMVFFFLYGNFFSRLLLVEAFLASALGATLWHGIYEHILRSLLRRNPPAFPTLIVGVTRESTRLIQTLNAQRNPLFPVAILDGSGAKEAEIDGVPVLGKLNKLEETLERYRITHLIQCADMEHTMNLLSACRNRGITYAVLPSVFGVVEGDERMEALEGKAMTMVGPSRNRLGWFFR